MARARPNAGRLVCPGWSSPVLGLAGRGDDDRRARWSAGLVSLSMTRPLDREVTHFPLDDTRIAAVPAFWIELTAHLGKQNRIMIVIMVKGGKTPVSTRETG